MGRIIICLVLLVALVWACVIALDGASNHQDAQAQRLYAEAALSRANAESSAIRADAQGRMLAALFPYLALACVAMIVGGVSLYALRRPIVVQEVQPSLLSQTDAIRLLMTIASMRNDITYLYQQNDVEKLPVGTHKNG